MDLGHRRVESGWRRVLPLFLCKYSVKYERNTITRALQPSYLFLSYITRAQRAGKLKNLPTVLLLLSEPKSKLGNTHGLQQGFSGAAGKCGYD